MDKTATWVRDLDGFAGRAALYRLSEPHAEYSWDDDEKAPEHDYVVVSAVVDMFSGPETYIFPATETGEVVNWGEMPGSFKGALDHCEALSRAGYIVTVPTT